MPLTKPGVSRPLTPRPSRPKQLSEAEERLRELGEQRAIAEVRLELLQSSSELKKPPANAKHGLGLWSPSRLKALAIHEGLDYRKADWWDSIDSVVVKEMRNAKVAQQPTVASLNREIRALGAEEKQLGGTIQSGMGIGERPAQGGLFENLRGEAERIPLADTEQMALRQARAAEIARGQAEMPLTKPAASEALGPAAQPAQATEGVTRKPVVVRQSNNRQFLMNDTPGAVYSFREALERTKEIGKTNKVIWDVPLAQWSAKQRMALDEVSTVLEQEAVIPKAPVGARRTPQQVPESVEPIAAEPGVAPTGAPSAAEVIDQLKVVLPRATAADEIAAILPDGTPLAFQDAVPGSFRMGARHEGGPEVPRIAQWFDAGVIRTGLEENGTFYAEIRGAITPQQRATLGRFMQDAPNVVVDIAAADGTVIKTLEGTPNTIRRQLAATSAAPPALTREERIAAIRQARTERLGGGGAVPPSEPPVTTGGVPPTGAVPKGPTPAVTSALSQAKAIVDRDAPGLVTRIIDIIPGPKQVQRGLHPSLGMNRKVLEPYVAEGNVLGTTSTQLSEVRVPVVNRLKETFGEGVVKGTEKARIKFLGTPAQAKYPATNTLYDIAQNPHLYDLTPVQRAAIEESEEALGRIFETVRGEYALDIGKFQNRPGSMFLSNVEKPEAGKGIFEAAVRTSKSSRAKTRFYETGRERWEHDVARGIAAPYDPVVDVEHLIGAEMHGGLSRMAGRAVYKEGLGGLDRMGALKATGHEALVKKMVGLRTRLQNLQAAKGRLSAKQQEAIGDFLSSPLEDTDLTALHQGLEPEITRGRNVGMGLDDITKEIAGVRAQISGLQPAWKTANTKGYQFVQEGIYKYFPDADAAQIRRLAEVSNNPLLRHVDDLRATAFGGDLSPVSIQMVTAWLSDPVGVSQALAKRGARGGMFTEESMLAWAKANPEIMSRFTRGTGINPLGGVDKEFSVGLIGKVPGVGKFWTAFNETVYRPVMRLMMDIFETSYQAGLKHGLSEEQAIAVAADDAMKIIPRLNPRRLGMSQAEAARYRAVLTSVSFLTQPTALMTDATKAFLKMGLKQPITQSERFAVQRVSKIIAVTEALAVSTAVGYALKEGHDPKQAALDALNPTHPNFMAITLPWGAKVGLGGPFRSLIRAVVPREVPGIPVPVPFAGIYRFGMSKMGPALRAAYEVAPGVNRDYRGRTIRKHDSVPLDILRSIEHVVSGIAPLTAGTTYRTLRQSEGLQAAGEEALSQFAGTNYIPFDAVWNAKLRWDKELQPYRDIPSNDQEVIDKPAEATGQPPDQFTRAMAMTRSRYRKDNPEVDAKLFITGAVDSLSDTAFPVAVRLMKENGITVQDIDSLKVKEHESPTVTERRAKFEAALGIVPASTTAPKRPITTPTTQLSPQEIQAMRLRLGLPASIPTPVGAR